MTDTAKSSNPSFRYQPLNEKTHEIRLFEFILKPGYKKKKYNEDEEVRCELVHVKYSTRDPNQDPQLSSSTTSNQEQAWGKFAALSYVWGSPTLPTRSIVLSGYEFPVTLNLHRALIRLRRLVHEDDTFPRRIWIDAICVDQSSICERNKQVPRMRYIYSYADAVICSLSPEWTVKPDGSTEAKVMNWKPSFMALHLLDEIYSSGQQRKFAEDLQSGRVEYVPSRWAALFTFFANPYWSRLWIVQEIVLASKSKVILAGRRSIPWHTVANASRLFNSLAYNTRNDIMRSVQASGRASIPFSSNVAKIVDIDAEMKRRLTPHRYAQPSWLIRMTGESQAQNQKDKVYGMLSLIDPKVADLIQVDYEKTAATVWTDFAAAFVQTNGSLVILPDLAQPDHNRARGAPSWVPDLGNGETAPPFARSSSESISSPRPKKTKVERSMLTVEGVLLDTIDGLTAVRRPFDNLFLNQSTEKRMIQAESASRKRQPTSVEEARHALTRTTFSGCMSDRPASGFPPLGWLKEHQERSHSVRRVLTFIEQNSQFRVPWGHRLTDVFQDDRRSNTGSDREYMSNSDYIDSMLNYRRLATTEGGRTALVPCDTRPGDLIVALYGYSGRGVLRRTGNSWRWVGSCYIDGLMDDINVQQKKKYAEELVIC